MEVTDLIYYTPEKLNQYPSGINAITITAGGNFTLSKSLAVALGLTCDTKALLVQNNKDPKEWYLTFSNEGHNMRAKSLKENNTFGFTSIALSKIFFKSLSVIPKTYKFMVSITPILNIGNSWLYPIITSSVKEINHA